MADRRGRLVRRHLGDPARRAITGAYVARAGGGFGWIALSADVALAFAGLGAYW